MKKFVTALIALVAVGMSIQAQTPKRELRSVWFTTVANIDWPSTKGTTAAVIAKQKAELITYLDNYQKRNFNGVCIQVRSMADAIYPSSYEPWSAVISGTRGVNPGWDPLEFAVEECHKRGMECWAWVNPFRQRKVNANYSTTQDQDLANKGWLLTYNSGSDYYTVLNPGLAAARQRSLDVCKEIYTNYKIDGMLFDDYFYPNGIPETSSAGDWSLYQSYKSSAGSSAMSMGDWRRENVNTFVRDLYNQIAADRPDMRYGIGPAGVAYMGALKYGYSKPSVTTTDWQYSTIYCDPWAWIVEGTIDFLAPQLYWSTTHSTAPFGPLCSWYSTNIPNHNCHFFASVGPYQIYNGSGQYSSYAAGWADMVKMTQLTRQDTKNNAPGMIYYSGKYFDTSSYTGLGEYLQNNVYQSKVLTPVITWKSHPTYTGPKNLTYSGGALNWAAVSGAKSNSIIRYTVYAVPEGVSVANAQAADGDGIDVKYLLDVTYDTSFTIPDAKQSGYWYAVCTYDGYGYESEPSYFGYAMAESAKTTLISPINGATPSWDATFSWQAVSGATYSLMIATDAAMSDVVVTENELYTSSTVIDLEGMTPGARMYWQIYTQEPGKMVTASDVAYFTVPAKLAGLAPTLVSPANGTEVPESITLKWNTVTGATGYNVVVATDASFNNVRFSETIEGNVGSYNFASSRLGKGTYYWRVESLVPHRNNGISASRSFVVNTIDVGNYESGYTIHKDPASYYDTGAYIFENLWMRSVRSDFLNISFESDGVFNRGIAISGDYIYMSGRVQASSTSAIYLRKYSLFTGEHISDIYLNGGQVPFYPCNDVQTDSKGNVFISSLSLPTTGVIYLHRVNVEDGSVALAANINCSDRLDHVGVWGDISSGSFYVMAVGASTNNFYRWKVVNGTVTETKTATAQALYPSTAANIGIAPRVYPVSETLAYIDGGATAFSLYNILTGELVGTFGETSLIPSGQSNNGGAVFSYDGEQFMVYACNDQNSDTGHRFRLVRGNLSGNANSLVGMWTFPEYGLGTVNSTTCSAPVAVRAMSDDSMIIATYATGNGLSTYKLSKIGLDAVESVSDDSADWSVRGRTVDFGSTQAVVRVYSLAGSLLQVQPYSSTIELPWAGTFVVNTPTRSRLISVK